MVEKLLAGALFSVITLAAASQAYAQANINEKRQQAMKDMSAANKAIKAAVQEKNYATVEAKAKDIMGTADKLVSLFPAGSTTGKTKAKPEIWEKSDDFGKAAKNLSKAAGELISAAKAGDDVAVGTKFKSLGDACSGCHKPFRAEKYGE